MRYDDDAAVALVCEAHKNLHDVSAVFHIEVARGFVCEDDLRVGSERAGATMKEVVDIGLTIDERIADGYYYSKTMRLLRQLLQNPELLEAPFETEVTV